MRSEAGTVRNSLKTSRKQGQWSIRCLCLLLTLPLQCRAHHTPRRWLAGVARAQIRHKKEYVCTPPRRSAVSLSCPSPCCCCSRPPPASGSSMCTTRASWTRWMCAAARAAAAACPGAVPCATQPPRRRAAARRAPACAPAAGWCHRSRVAAAAHARPRPPSRAPLSRRGLTSRRAQCADSLQKAFSTVDGAKQARGGRQPPGRPACARAALLR